MGYSNPVPPEALGDFQAAVAAGMAIADPRNASPEAGSGVYTVVPEDYSIVSLESYLPQPLRVRQGIQLDDAESFIEYVKAFRIEGQTRIFFAQAEGDFLAVLDYHSSSVDPEWCTHQARFKAQQSVEFQAWMGQNKRQMQQVEFARFLEENMPDIVEPNSAELLQCALTFEAKKSVEFSSGVRLANGQIQFQYDEVVRGTAQKGTIEIPEEFVLGVPIHVNGPAYRIKVRLRWRLQEGKVVFWYELVRPHRSVEDALKEIRERIAAETLIKVLAGSLPK